MDAATQAQVTFFLTGRRTGEHLESVDGWDLRPALFAGYRDLTTLRYDFPLVLVSDRTQHVFVRPLSELVDDALVMVAGDADADRIRKDALRMEQELRVLAAPGTCGTLSSCWTAALERLHADADASVLDSLRRVRAAIAVDGEMADCDAVLPARVLRHAWSTVQAKKASAFHKRLNRLVLKLSDILKADVEHSEEGRTAARLKASVGSVHGEAFDFDVMSRLLSRARPLQPSMEGRRQRIHQLLTVLTSQPFFPAAGNEVPSAGAPFGFVFDSCGEALEAFKTRLPRLIALARAIAVAELEIDGQYNEARHDALFEQFGANGLDPRDLAPFPDYLVMVNAGRLSATEQSHLMEILASGLPIKVLLQVDDLLEEPATADGPLALGTRSRQIAQMAVGLNEVYVLQAASSHLYRFREQTLDGLAYEGPALFSVYSGASGVASGVPPYLMAAAAMESRAFPAFTYDPSAGPNWASRFHLDANPQVDLDWPIRHFAYEDEQHQRVSEDLAFTMVDFVAADRRVRRHLARVPRAHWNGSLVPPDESLSRERRGLPEQVPGLLMVDGRDMLHKVIADERLIREARRCREMWHSLQELGGVHNSHADALLARERKAWEARMHEAADSHAHADRDTPASPPAPVADRTASAQANASVPAEPERSPDDAYIETPRCSTCNECTTINGRMFAYDGNRQAYIANLDAGTYAQLVEAAESCQVSIIHPGKPRNPNEPGLDELLKRAAPFL